MSTENKSVEVAATAATSATSSSTPSTTTTTTATPSATTTTGARPFTVPGDDIVDERGAFFNDAEKKRWFNSITALPPRKFGAPTGPPQEAPTVADLRTKVIFIDNNACIGVIATALYTLALTCIIILIYQHITTQASTHVICDD
jgi:hypothetical protein